MRLAARGMLLTARAAEGEPPGPAIKTRRGGRRPSARRAGPHGGPVLAHLLAERGDEVGADRALLALHRAGRVPLGERQLGRRLDEVALVFPELKIVGGHIGYPWTDEMIGLAWKHENVFIDTSAYLPRYYPPQLLHYLKTYGQDKVLFGTNFPQLSLEKCTAQVKELNLPLDIQAKFLAGNAKRIFKL